MAEINLAQEIAHHLKMYSSEVEQDLQAAKKEVGEKAVQQLRSAGNFGDRTGRYRKGWKLKKVGDNYVIHNATDASLTHLLEKGHVLRNGGRSKSFVHIKPAEEMVITEFETLVRKRLS
ncbi:prophage pi2 protein 37 [Leuconostoc gelidum subsp. gasicomitatum]|uniref:Prophage pi2 protein 37 n=1 Tax=Leuconostoc gasicomitatum TaxID=115778 RepID=A0ABP2B3S3_9LACO|nr:HK97 gp10 family phage protein [Leuconostoc gasicomitatum]MBZ5984998.1 HK97 gp10 family phage protein [Leuconostoc gasicomitatum]CUW10552.1 prophage pi2 protein 37 [Leuconostoc gasicomitatum]